MIITSMVNKDSATESNLSLIKRFSKRLQGAGTLRRAKANRYTDRPLSAYKKKQQALKRIQRQTEFERLRKLGLIEDVGRKKSY
ncbi:MAG: hypothetical protein AAB505_01875 [Patescibacteria group bacterium]